MCPGMIFGRLALSSCAASYEGTLEHMSFDTPAEEKQRMEAAGFKDDPPWQGYNRWTHVGTGITALRQPYMTDQQWQMHKEEKIREAQHKMASIP